MQREMIYVWTLLRARTKGLEVRSDGAKDVAGHLVSSLHKALEE